MSALNLRKTLYDIGKTRLLLNNHYIELENDGWIGVGGTCLVYHAFENINIDGRIIKQKILLKEFYPILSSDSGVTVNRKDDGSLEFLFSDNLNKNDEYSVKLERFKMSFEIFVKCKNDSDMNNYTVLARDCVNQYGTYYLIMDYDAASELDEYIKTNPPLYDFLNIIKKAARALLHLHKFGYIHLDITPQNLLLLEKERTIKIMDSDSFIFKEDFIKKDIYGNYKNLWFSYSEGFTAPEIRKSNNLNPVQRVRFSERGECADIYSLGSVIFYYLLGRTPNINQDGILDDSYVYEFEIDRIINNFSSKNLLLVKNMLRRMISYKTADRYKSMNDVIRAIDRILPEKNMDISNGIDEYHMWEASRRFYEKNENLFKTEHIPQLAKGMKIKKLDIYGSLNESKFKRVLELLEADQVGSKRSQKSENKNVYMQAAGGGGKSIAAAELFKKYIDTGKYIPLYLDFADYENYELKYLESYEMVVPYMLAWNLFGTREKSAAEQIFRLFSEQKKNPRFLLIIDNLHKIQLDIFEQAIASVNFLDNEFTNVWLIVCGRTDKKYLSEKYNFLIKNQINIQPLSYSYMKKCLEKIIERNLTEAEISMLKAQENALGIPFLFMRYLEIAFNTKNSGRLPLISNVMRQYFDEYETQNVPIYSWDNLSIKTVTDKYLPVVAYNLMISEHSQCSIEDIYKWLPRHLTEEERVRFIKICTDILAVISVKSNIVNFTHDCYEEYFASVFIAKKWEYVLEENIIQGFQHINHIWDKKITSGSIDLVSEKRENIIQNTYDQFESQKEIGSKYAENILYNIWSMFENPYEDLAVKWLMLGADLGQNMLQFYLGRAYGRGIKKIQKNNSLKLYWYTRSAENNCKEAQYELGKLYLNGDEKIQKNIFNAESWLKKAAKANNIDAQFELGKLYISDTTKNLKSYSESEKWLKKAAGSGHSKAQYTLGNFYWNGFDSDPNFKEAVFWYKKAATQGHSEAQYRLGDAYLNGKGVLKSKETADFWYAKAEDGRKLTKNYGYLVNNIYFEAENLIKYQNNKKNMPENVNETDFTFPVTYKDISNMKIQVIDNPDKKYEKPDFIKRNYKELLKAHALSNVWNAENIRIDDWQFTGNKFKIFTSRTTYFDSLVTNRAADLKLRCKKTVREKLDPGPKPKSLANSLMSNHIGFNGFVCSSDGYIPLVKRNMNMSVEKGVYGNSVQASLKTKYALKNEKKFNLDGIIYSIICEIEDELKIKRKDLKEYPKLLYAYYNLVELKPQFLFYAKSLKTKAEIEADFFNNIKKNDTELLIDGTEFLWIHETELTDIFIMPDGIRYKDYDCEMVPSASGALVMLIRYMQNQNLI